MIEAAVEKGDGSIFSGDHRSKAGCLNAGPMPAVSKKWIRPLFQSPKV
jgi:hypothetical protein